MRRIVALVLGMYLWSGCINQAGDTVYVDLITLEQELAMFKELREKVEAYGTKKRSPLIELENEIRKAQAEIEETDVEEQRKLGEKIKRWRNLNEEVEYEISIYVGQEEEEIWKRMNGLIRDFGKKEGYALVLGASGNGNIMYSDSTLNVTKRFLGYADKRYNNITMDQ